MKIIVHRRLAAACIALSIFSAAMASGVSVAVAQGQPAPVETPTQTATDDDRVVVETFTPSGVKISTEAYNKNGDLIPVPPGFESQGIVVAADQTALTPPYTANAAPNGITGQGSNSGTGGSSSASGCIRVTVNNEKETLLGFTSFWFHTWTSWCWNSSTKTISDVRTGWYLSDVYSTIGWRSMIVDTTEHYQWIQGHGKSGFEHEKQGHLQECVPQLGCWRDLYPHNRLWSHSDGTWSWETAD